MIYSVTRRTLLVLLWSSVGMRMACSEEVKAAKNFQSSDKVLKVMSLQDFKVGDLGRLPVAGEYVDIQTEHMGIISPLVKEALVVKLGKQQDASAVETITFSVSVQDAKYLDNAAVRNATIRLDNLNGFPTFGEILSLPNPLNCERIRSLSMLETISYQLIPIELDVKLLDPTPYSGPPRPHPTVLCENCRIAAYVDNRAVCEAIVPGKSFFGKTLRGRLSILSIGDRYSAK